MNELISKFKYEIGEIYKLQPKRKGAKSRLVMIVEVDDSDYTALVFLINNMAKAAIPRDVTISKEIINSDFDVVVMTEYFARIDLENLNPNSMIGRLSARDVERIRTVSFNSPFGALPEAVESDGIAVGSYPLQKFDSVWNFRGEEFDNFSLITFVRNKLSSDYVSRILNLYEDLTPILDECSLDALFLRGRESVGVAS
jgi:hypothetical protein